jgi:hypothetical protein
MQRCLYALFSVVIALCGVLLVAAPRFFLLPPVPVGMVAHNMHGLLPKHIGKAKAEASDRYQNDEFFKAGGHGMRFVSFACINNHQESNAYSQCSRRMMFSDNKELFYTLVK